MKRIIPIVLLFVLHLQAVAQDKIVKISGEELSARVLEITLQEVLFQHPDSLQGITQRLPKKEVFMVQFENGTKEVFEQNLTGATAAETLKTPDEMFQLGREDAIRYYKGNGAMWGSAASSLVMFPLGLAGSLVIGATPPKVEAQPVSNVQFLMDPAYVQGYKEQAHRKKKGKALAGVGIGAGIQLALIMLLVAAYQ